MPDFQSSLELEIPFTPPRNELRTWTANLIETTLAGQDQFFGGAGQPPANLDWPVPKGYVPNITLRSLWTQNMVGTTLAGQDQFFGAAGQGVANLDWPVPKGPLYPISLRTFLNSPYADYLYSPFFQTEWPVPKGYVPNIDLKTHFDRHVRMIGQDIFFGAAGQGVANLDWPVPRGYVPNIGLRTFHSLMTFLPGAIVNIFGMRRAERATPGSASRVDIARAERTTPGSAQRIDE